MNNATVFEDLLPEIARCSEAELHSPISEWARLTLVRMAKALDEANDEALLSGNESLARLFHRIVADWHDLRAAMHREYGRGDVALPEQAAA